ncbi:MAG TPA: type IX secretion system membrane protein PorP/SprF [Flavobacteriales bacterium]|nr:type IX secretion system membrane protein PorP/SprF [Flavobacteriales bacterium]
MLKKTTYLVLILTGSLSISSWETATCQDIQFSQFYAAPLYLNPALTGNTEQFRIAGTYRKQWPKIPGAWTSQTFAYDQSIRKINSGIGLLLIHDKAGTAGLRFTNIGLCYAFKFPITRKVFSSFGVRASYTTRAINADELVFWDQIVRDDPTSLEILSSNVVKYADFSTGYIVYSKTSWIGAAFDHLTTPNQSFIGLDTKLPLKYSVHAGHRFPLKKTVKGNVQNSLSVAANYKGQLQWDQFDVGVYMTINGIVGGLWYRGIPGLKAYKPGYSNNDALVFLLGYQMKEVISIGYSFDLTISRLTIASGGSHEISLIYEYAQPKYKRDNMKKDFMMPCMKF